MKILNDITKTEVGWIAPDGEVFGYPMYIYGSQDHEEMADYIKEIHGFPDAIVEKYGYIKYSVLRIAKAYRYHMTQEQKQKVLEFMDANNLAEIGLGYPGNSVSRDEFDSMPTEEIDYRCGGIMFQE